MKIIAEKGGGYLVDATTYEIRELIRVSTPHGSGQAQPCIGLEINVGELVLQVGLNKQLEGQFGDIADELDAKRETMKDISDRLRRMGIIKLPEKEEDSVEATRVLDVE